MKRPEQLVPWPVRYSEGGSIGSEPGLEPALQADLVSALKACADEPLPIERLKRRATSRALEHFAAQPAVPALDGLRKWFGASLRPGRILVAVAVIVTVQLGMAMAEEISEVSRHSFSQLAGWIADRAMVHPRSHRPVLGPAPIPVANRQEEDLARSPQSALESTELPAVDPGRDLSPAAPLSSLAPEEGVRRQPITRPHSRTLPSSRRVSPVSASTSSNDPLASEAALVSRAIGLAGPNPRASLLLLRGYWREFPAGALRGEAAVAELSARLALGENAVALTWLDGFARDQFRGMEDTADELRVARLELMAGAGRCLEAVPLLDTELTGAAVGGTAGVPRLRGRALLARAACKARAGDTPGNRADLQRYLAELPQGPRATQVKRLLGLPVGASTGVGPAPGD